MPARPAARLAAALLACVAAAGLASPAAAQMVTYDVASSFLTFNTPGSPFLAGYTTDYLGALTPYTDRAVLTFNNGQTVQTYSTGDYSNGAPSTPGLFLAGPTGVNAPNVTPKFGPNVLGLRPGAQGQFSTIRFVAPVDAVYSFTFSGYGLDAGGPDGGTTSDQNLAVPDPDYDVLLYGGSINGFGYDESGQTFTVSNVLLNAGQFVDFSVGSGDNEDYQYDMTALDAQVTFDAGTPAVTTPEPTTVALLGAGVLALGGVARRRARTA